MQHVRRKRSATSFLIVGLCFGTALQLSGCTVAATNLTFSELPSQSTELPVVYVYYQDFDTANTWIMTTTIYMDGNEVVTLGQNMFTRIAVPPGQHTFTTSTDKMWGCHDSLVPNFEWPPIHLEVNAPGPYFLKFSTENYEPNHSAPICQRHLFLSSELEGTTEIVKTKYVQPVGSP